MTGVPFLSQSRYQHLMASYTPDSEKKELIVASLLKLVSAGDNPKSGHVRPENFAPLMSLALFSPDRELDGSREQLLAALRKLSLFAINQIEATEESSITGEHLPRFSEALKRLFGFSSTRTPTGSSTDRKRSCWHYLFTAETPENEYHSKSWSDFKKRHIPEMLRHVAEVLMLEEFQETLIRERVERLPTKSKHSAGWITLNWIHIFEDMFEVDFHLVITIALSLGLRRSASKSDKHAALDGAANYGRLVFFLAHLHKACAQLDKRIQEEGKNTELWTSAAYYATNISSHSYFENFSFTSGDREIVARELAQRTPTHLFGERLAASRAGEILIKKLELSIRLCECGEPSDRHRCPLHSMLKHIEKFSQLLSEDWTQVGRGATLLRGDFHPRNAYLERFAIDQFS